MSSKINDISSNEQLKYVLDEEDLLDISLLNLQVNFEEVDLQVTLTCVNKLKSLFKTQTVN